MEFLEVVYRIESLSALFYYADLADSETCLDDFGSEYITVTDDGMCARRLTYLGPFVH